MSKIYRFDVRYCQGEKEVYRLVDLPANFSLEAFHRSILASIGFDDSQLASFYISDTSWNKGTEFTLMDMGENPDEAETFAMADTCLQEVIGLRQKRLVYVYDYAVMWTLYIELKDIREPDPTLEYPVLVEEAGQMPHQTKARRAADIEELTAEDLLHIKELREKNQDFIGNEEEQGQNDDEGYGDDFSAGTNGSYHY